MSLSSRGRAEAYLALYALRGSPQPRHYRDIRRQDHARSYPDQASMLAGTLVHAVETVPHYRGIATAAEIRDDPHAALAGFPVLEREEIRRAGDALLSESGDRAGWRRQTSGGSTGEPVVLIQDADHRAMAVAIHDVYSEWAGGGLGARELRIWGSDEDVLRIRKSRTARIGNRLLRRTVLNAYHLTPGTILPILDSLQEGPPRLVVAYAQAGYEVARFAAERGIEIPPQRGVISTAGTLYPFMRERLEKFFGCDVFDSYGSRETGDIAGECGQRDGLHVLPWSCHVEVLGDDGEPAGPGEAGDVVVTGFTNRAMPLIRYRIGDRARMRGEARRCPCGRETQMLAEVSGRVVDVFIAADGTRVDAGIFTEILFFRPWLQQFEIVQLAPDRVRYRIIAPAGVPASEAREIEEKTKLALGPDCRVEIETVDVIYPLPSGKRSFSHRAF